MSSRVLIGLIAALAMSGAALAAPSGSNSLAVADAARPAADTARDADRKPMEMLEFAGIKPGQTVGDFLPGGGYFTRIFSKAAGPKGTVYAIINPPAPDAKAPNPIIALAAQADYPNVKVVQSGIGSVVLPSPADIIWTSQNYHDLFLTRFNVDIAVANKAIFNALKPGGYYIVLDHAASPGAPLIETANTLHRIDPALVRSQLESAGFKFISESKALANSQDDHSRKVFDPTLRGHTDQFIYKFQRPK